MKVGEALSLALALALGGCYSQQPLPPSESADNGPAHSIADLKAHGTEECMVPVTDLAPAHSLEVKIDKVSGRRVLVNHLNQVVVTPGSRFVAINGIDYPLAGEIRWRNGVLCLP